MLQWAFAAATGHPALREVCEHIAHHDGDLFSEDVWRDVLERTGPGPWTDAVLRHARLHQLPEVPSHSSPELLLQRIKRIALCVTASVLGLAPWTDAVLRHARLHCLPKVPAFQGRLAIAGLGSAPFKGQRSLKEGRNEHTGHKA